MEIGRRVDRWTGGRSYKKSGGMEDAWVYWNMTKIIGEWWRKIEDGKDIRW